MFVASLALLILLTSIHPIFPHEQYLQHIGTLLIMGIMIGDIRRCRLSLLAVVGLSVFCALHIIGARWIYSYVPYAEWVRALHLPFDFASERNHYDRFVHFAFGLLLLPLFYDISARRLGECKFLAIMVAWLMIQTGSLIYELFEWSLTWFLSPDAAEGYNGQQGDGWDAQKDMALALLGSSLTAIGYWIKETYKP